MGRCFGVSLVRVEFGQVVTTNIHYSDKNRERVKKNLLKRRGSRPEDQKQEAWPSDPKRN